MENIRRIREGQKLTYVELADRLTKIGRPIPVLGLRRIEKGERRVDVDDLLALAVALGVMPVDLLVPNTAADDEPYNVTQDVAAPAAAVRDWISGQGLLAPPSGHAELFTAMPWMPRDRATALTHKYVLPMQAAWQREEVRRALAEDGEGE